MQTPTRLFLFLMLGAWIGLLNRPTIAASHVCDELCGTGADCDAECWLTQEDFDNGGPSTTCGDQGYSCCGDGVCDTGVEGCNDACITDCGETTSCGDQCEYTYQCPGGYICDSAHECIVGASNVGGTGTSCANKTDCMGNDVCEETDCGIPQDDYCQDSPVCGSCPSGEFCDPGIGRCQYDDNPGCPT